MANDDNRARSLTLVQRLSLPVPSHLPAIDPGVLRDSEEVMSRLLCAHAAAAASYGFDRQKASGWLEEEDVVDQLTEAESRFLSGDSDAAVFQERVEAMWALAWALGLTASLAPETPCDSSFARMLPDLLKLESSNAVRTRVRPRDVAEIEEAQDLYYCTHWGVRELTLKGQAPPIPTMAQWVIEERRRALEWLLSASEWEEPDLST